MSNHVIHVKSCSSCQIMSFLSNYVILVKSCQSFGPFPVKHSLKSGGRGGEGGVVKYVFLCLRRQLRCLAEGKTPLLVVHTKPILVAIQPTHTEKQTFSKYILDDLPKLPYLGFQEPRSAF
jgi:hypothetical protein